MPAAPDDQQVPRPQEVFISYSRKDTDFVRRLDEALKSRGREAWVDWEDIRPTEEWMQAIYAAIDGADTFIFVLTPDSVTSAVCGSNGIRRQRSEEHTSELQSLRHLVCRLLLEKKKKKKNNENNVQSTI